MSQQKSTGKYPGKRSSLAEGLSASSLPSESGQVWAGQDIESPESPGEFTAFVDVLESEPDVEPSPPPVPVREGLPPSYRMRADRHYVELLDRPPVIAEPSPRDAAAFDEVARSLAAAESCMSLMNQPKGLMPVAARDVLKAEMARASALLQMTRFVKGDLTAVKAAVSSHALVQRVTQAADAERRIRGVTLITREDVSDIRFAGDETMLANVLFAHLLGTFALLDGVDHPQVAFATAVDDEGNVVLSIAQDRVAAPHTWTARPLGDSWPDNAGGIFGAVAMGAAQRLAQTLGGRFVVNVADRSTSLALQLPALQASATPPPVF